MTDHSRERSCAKILIVDDEVLFSAGIAEALKKLGYAIAEMVTTPEQAIRAAHDLMPDLIIMDISLGSQLDGIETYQKIRAELDIPVVYLTGYEDKELVERAKLTEPYGYLTKPVTFRDLSSTIETALYKHEAYRRVKRSEALLAKAEQLASLGSWEWDIQTGTLYWSDESFRAFGYRPQEVAPSLSLFLESVHPDDLAKVRTAMKRVLDGIPPFDVEFRIVRPDGTIRVLHSRGDLLVDNGGRPSRMVGMTLDVTERKQAEDLIKAQRDLGMALSAASNLEEALGMCLDAVLRVSDMDVAAVYAINDDSSLDMVLHRGVSDTFLRVVAHLPAELPEARLIVRGFPVYHGKGLAPLPSDLAETMVMEGIRAALAIPIMFQGRAILSLHLASRKSESIPTHVQAALETLGAQIGAAVARIRAEAEVRKGHEILEAFVNSTDDSLSLFDREKRFVVVNRALASRFDKQIKEMVGRTLFDFLPQDCARRREAIIERVFESKASVRCQQSQAGRHSDIVVNPVLGFDGAVHSVAVFDRDITAQKLTQTALKEAKDLAEAASRAKTDFLTNMSHELRTPLNAIIGFSEVLHDQLFGPLNETQLTHVRYIVESGHHLLELISEILDLARIESGGMRLDVSRFDLMDMLQGSVDIISEAARRKGIELRTHLNASSEDMAIEADEVKLRQVVLNLLSNAVKFTPERGAIHIRAYRAAHEAVISVIDNGIGLIPEDMERIFNAFEQVDSSASRREQGSGLGLSLARKLIEMHGGKIWAESDGLGKGTTFTMTIPMRLAESDGDEAPT